MAAMPLLFSYGTLQQEDVQLATFGRRLHGEPDELSGFELSLVKIEDAKVVAETGMTHYANVVFNGRSENRISGMVFEVTDAGLAAVDEYERDADYRRIVVTLASGRAAWVYLNDRRPSSSEQISDVVS
jgi:gamma-glutamylcyclotransferase (GGCT)/AIG2-like uncharacterized protein YtfP